jgi:hypothetical protein
LAVTQQRLIRINIDSGRQSILIAIPEPKSPEKSHSQNFPPHIVQCDDPLLLEVHPQVDRPPKVDYFLLLEHLFDSPAPLIRLEWALVLMLALSGLKLLKHPGELVLRWDAAPLDQDPLLVRTEAFFYLLPVVHPGFKRHFSLLTTIFN